MMNEIFFSFQIVLMVVRHRPYDEYKSQQRLRGRRLLLPKKNQRLSFNLGWLVMRLK